MQKSIHKLFKVMMYIFELKKNTYNYFQQCLNQTISKRLERCLLEKFICKRDINFLYKSAKIKRETEKLTSQIALKVRNGPNYVQLEDKLLFPSLLYVRCSMPSVLKFLRAESTEYRIWAKDIVRFQTSTILGNIAYWFIYLKVASSNSSCFEAYAGVFRLSMKGIFYPYVQ